MQNEKIKNKIYINIFLALLIGGISYFFIYPQYTGVGTFYSPTNNISGLIKQKSDYENTLSIANDYNRKIATLNSSYTDALNKLPINTLNKILPSSVDPVITIYELTKIANLPGSDMLLTDPRFSDDGAGATTDNTKKYNTLTVDFSLQGTYENLKYFLKNLENSDKVFNVTKLSFASEQNTKDASVLKYSLTVETYYLKQK